MIFPDYYKKRLKQNVLFCYTSIVDFCGTFYSPSGDLFYTLIFENTYTEQGKQKIGGGIENLIFGVRPLRIWVPTFWYLGMYLVDLL